jgi:outer membrane protein assembly factor BamB
MKRRSSNPWDAGSCNGRLFGERKGWQAALLLTFLLGRSFFLSASDWPQWRGPERNGVAPESPALANKPKLVWQKTTLMHGGSDTGHGSPVVAGERVYLYGSWIDSIAHDEVICLNAKTGSQVWRAEFPADKRGEVRCQGSTPCVLDGRLYVAGRKRVYCLDAASGKLIWKQEIDCKSDGIACSLAVVDGIAILICQGFYGFDALTGQVRWHRVEEPGPWNKNGTWGSYPSPIVWNHAGKNYVVCSCKYVELIDPATGEALWKLPWVEGGWSSWSGNSTPTIVGDKMVLMQKEGGMEAYSLSVEGPGKLWHVPDHDVATSPLIYQGHVYTIGGGDYGKQASIRCVDLLTGELAWEKPTPPQGCSSPVAADGKIIGFLNFGKELGIWKADPSQYSVLSTTPVNADGYSSMAFADGRLYIRLRDGLACYDLTERAKSANTRSDDFDTFFKKPVGQTPVTGQN